MVFHIPMFLGDKTATDSYELAEYLKTAIEGDSENFKKMNDEFNSKFPGYRHAARMAQKGVAEITGETSTHLEHKDQAFRALNDKGMGVWHPVVVVETEVDSIPQKCECGCSLYSHWDGEKVGDRKGCVHCGGCKEFRARVESCTELGMS